MFTDLTIKGSEQRHISHFNVVFLLLTLKTSFFAGIKCLTYFYLKLDFFKTNQIRFRWVLQKKEKEKALV